MKDACFGIELLYHCFVWYNFFSSGQTAVKLSGTEAANRAQCAAPDKPIGYWSLLVVFANLKRVMQCACFKSLGSRKGTQNATCIYWVWHSIYQENEDLFPLLPCREDKNGLLTLRIIVRCRLRVSSPVRRYTCVLRSRRHCRKANCVSPGVTQVTVV